MGRRPPYRLIVVGFIVLIVLAISTSAFDYPIVFLGKVTTETFILGTEGAETVTAVIVAQTGKIHVGGGAPGLLEADLAYAYKGDKPTVEYHTRNIRSDGTATLLITQDEYKDLILLGGTRINAWDIALGDSVPLDLTLDVGAGDLSADLHTLPLTRLRLESTSGDMTADLRGAWDHDLDVTVISAAGDVTLTLPETIGVRVLVESELGRIDVTGFTLIEGDYTGTYVNAAYAEDTAEPVITIRITSGRGDVALRAG